MISGSSAFSKSSLYIWKFSVQVLLKPSLKDFKYYLAAAAAAAAAAKSLQLCPTLCDRIDGSLPGSSVHGIFQAVVLEWIAIYKILKDDVVKMLQYDSKFGNFSNDHWTGKGQCSF